MLSLPFPPLKQQDELGNAARMEVSSSLPRWGAATRCPSRRVNDCVAHCNWLSQNVGITSAMGGKAEKSKYFDRSCLCPCAATVALQDENHPTVGLNTFFRGQREGSATFVIKTSPALTPGAAHLRLSSRPRTSEQQIFCLPKLPLLPSRAGQFTFYLLCSGLFFAPSSPRLSCQGGMRRWPLQVSFPPAFSAIGSTRIPYNTQFWTVTESKHLKETVNPGQAHMDGFPA